MMENTQVSQFSSNPTTLKAILKIPKGACYLGLNLHLSEITGV